MIQKFCWKRCWRSKVVGWLGSGALGVLCASTLSCLTENGEVSIPCEGWLTEVCEGISLLDEFLND